LSPLCYLLITCGWLLRLNGIDVPLCTKTGADYWFPGARETRGGGQNKCQLAKRIERHEPEGMKATNGKSGIEKCWKESLVGGKKKSERRGPVVQEKGGWGASPKMIITHRGKGIGGKP